MLKLSTSSVQAAAHKTVGCSEEALAESIYALSDASEALYSACADVEEVSQVLANLDMCAKGIKEGGLSKQVIGAFNSEGELSACCGQENLTVAGLEALDAAAIKSLSGTYTAALEGKMAEYWNKFVAFLKNLWSKVMNWFKALFTNRARWVKKLDAYQINKAVGPAAADLTVKSISIDDITKMIGLASTIATTVDSFARKLTSGESIPETFTKFDDEAKKLLDLEPQEKKFNELVPGGAGKLDSVRGQYKTQATDKKIQNVQGTINAAFKYLIGEAGKAGNLEGDAASNAKESVNKKRDALNAALKACRLENSLLMKAGSALDKLLRTATTFAKGEKQKQDPNANVAKDNK